MHIINKSFKKLKHYLYVLGVLNHKIKTFDSPVDAQHAELICNIKIQNYSNASNN